MDGAHSHGQFDVNRPALEIAIMIAAAIGFAQHWVPLLFRARYRQRFTRPRAGRDEVFILSFLAASAAGWPHLRRTVRPYAALRLRANTPSPPRPESISHAAAGNGTGAAVPLICTSAMRQLPELLLYCTGAPATTEVADAY
jgi:hypothetical protein